MDLKITVRDAKYKWMDDLEVIIKESRDENIWLWSNTESKKRILGDVAKLDKVPKEIGVILKYITETVGIIIYRKEQEIELIVGYLNSETYHVSFALEDCEVEKLLKGL